ncbi:ADP-ribosylglycohydrolase family protein [Labrys sp. KB_33_2]|uniref:ADP-ribosylglycohydrolase family protein n=1 Tax=Labrys sp. KB_33_2 TaxID=3237479 RepID=UPI003F928F2F
MLRPRCLPDGLPERLRRCAGTDWRLVGRDEISSTGYVMHTLEAALWAVSQSTCFREAGVHAVNLGGDVDTIGAVTGQLAGALRGRSNVPPAWQHKVLWGDSIIVTARSLALD